MEDLEKICQDFKGEVLSQGGESIQGILLYGSALGPEFRPKKSDYNFVIFAEPIDIGLLDRLAHMTPKWRKHRISPPLLISPDSIEPSLDSYPLEFLSMASRYRVLHGRDFLQGITFEKSDVRLQCERELRSKLLLFRRAYLESEGKAKHLKHLVSRGLPSLVAIIRGMLFLRDGPWKLHGRELFDACDQSLGLPGPLLHRLHDLRQQAGTPSADEIRQHMGETLEFLDGLASEVDRW